MYEYACEVIKVVDGDTSDLNISLGFNIYHKCRVRLYGIDTPECRTRNKDEKARGKLAKVFVENAIANGNEIIVRTKLKDSKGKYGRVLGEILVDSININEELVRKHLAVRYFGQSKNDVGAEHEINKQKLLELGVYQEIKNPS